MPLLLAAVGGAWPSSPGDFRFNVAVPSPRGGAVP